MIQRYNIAVGVTNFAYLDDFILPSQNNEKNMPLYIAFSLLAVVYKLGIFALSTKNRPTS